MGVFLSFPVITLWSDDLQPEDIEHSSRVPGPVLLSATRPLRAVYQNHSGILRQ